MGRTISLVGFWLAAVGAAYCIGTVNYRYVARPLHRRVVAAKKPEDVDEYDAITKPFRHGLLVGALATVLGIALLFLGYLIDLVAD